MRARYTNLVMSLIRRIIENITRQNTKNASQSNDSLIDGIQASSASEGNHHGIQTHSAETSGQPVSKKPKFSLDVSADSHFEGHELSYRDELSLYMSKEVLSFNLDKESFLKRDL